jgi:hypothetical protein
MFALVAVNNSFKVLISGKLLQAWFYMICQLRVARRLHAQVQTLAEASALDR